MAYATISHVEAMVSIRSINGQSDPSVQQVKVMIEDIAGDIDAALAAANYAIPVSATGALPFLRQLNAYGAAMRVEASSAKGKESPHLEFLERQYNKRWDQLVNGDVVLPGGGDGLDTTTASIRAGGSATSMFSISDER